MTSSIARAACALFLGITFGGAGAQEDGSPKGVNPKENLTKLELIHRFEGFSGRARIHAIAVKYDRALSADLGANIEIPVVRFSAPGLGETGLGDAEFRVRMVRNDGRLSWIGALEVVAPTASNDLLGAGKWQLNPGFGAVYALSRSTFVYAGYKHVLSVGGDSARRDIDQSQPRLLAAFTSPRGWWVLGDLTYTRDHKAKTNALDIEAEAGAMLAPTVAISARIGTSALDSTRNLMFGLNLRHIF